MAPLALAVAAVAGSVAVHRVAKSRRDGLAVRRHEIPWRGTHRLRVVQLSDIHVGPTTPPRVLADVASVTHGLNPDLVVLTGDYVNASVFFLGRVTDFVRSLPKPCIATLGNHDHWAGPDRVSQALARGGAKVLRNESTVVRIDRAELLVVGVDDGHSRNADIERSFRGVDAERALVLSHYPNTADRIAQTGAPLVLSGHTHAGQIAVPWVTRTVARAAGNPYLHGFYRVGERTDLYVNAGLGHSFPGFRTGVTRPEVAVFDLDPELAERRSAVAVGRRGS